MTVAVRKNSYRRGDTERQRPPIPPALLAIRVPPSARERPAPGSEEARDMGCQCHSPSWRDWDPWITLGCCLHDPERDE